MKHLKEQTGEDEENEGGSRGILGRHPKVFWIPQNHVLQN